VHAQGALRKSGYGLYTQDGKFIVFDAVGNQTVQKALEASKKANVTRKRRAAEQHAVEVHLTQNTPRELIATARAQTHKETAPDAGNI